MSDILCIYYSRTGHTRRAMEEVADALGAEVTAITDDRDRSGWRGYIRCGMDAMKTSTRPLLPFQTETPLNEYRLVIIGSPVWAGRCSWPFRRSAGSVSRRRCRRRGLCCHPRSS